jgi:hypothetical protein
MHSLVPRANRECGNEAFARCETRVLLIGTVAAGLRGEADRHTEVLLQGEGRVGALRADQSRHLRYELATGTQRECRQRRSVDKGPFNLDLRYDRVHSLRTNQSLQLLRTCKEWRIAHPGPTPESQVELADLALVIQHEPPSDLDRERLVERLVVHCGGSAATEAYLLRGRIIAETYDRAES